MEEGPALHFAASFLSGVAGKGGRSLTTVTLAQSFAWPKFRGFMYVG